LKTWHYHSENMCLWFLDRKKQRRRSQAGQGKSDSRQQSASTDSRQQSAKFENETGDEVTTPPQGKPDCRKQST
jgi:hypothetical protein